MSSGKRKGAKKPRRHPRRKREAGLAPGTIVVDADAHDLDLRLTRYGPTLHEEKAFATSEELRAELHAGSSASEPTVVWVEVTGLGDAGRLDALGAVLGLHPLTIEDIANVEQRPKSEVFGTDWLAFLRVCDDQHPPHEAFASIQLAMLLRPGLVVTFAERPTDVFEPVRRRIHAAGPRIRAHGADYLAYALLDAAVDRYLVVLDHFRELLEEMEEVVLDQAQDVDLHQLHRLRRDLLHLGRVALPLRDVVSLAGREQHGEGGAVFSEPVRIYLRDCHDHAMRVVDRIDSYREFSASLLDIHLSMVGFRTNEVMKVLTMISTIFIPLSFLAGLYGMNFDTKASRWNMPELGAVYGYPVLLGVMLALAGGLLVFFKRRGWF